MRTITNPTSFRANVVAEYAKVLTKKHYAANLEKGIFNWSIQQADMKNVVKKWENPYFVQIYIDRMRSIWVNLRDPVIVKNVLEGKIRPHKLGQMSHQEMSLRSGNV